MNRSSIREVRHIVRQNGSLIEEIIAVRSGRLVKYVKKNNRGVVTCGSYRLNNRTATERTEKTSTTSEDKKKGGLLEAVLKVMIPSDKKKDISKKDNK